jgi:hypothetical protein
MARRPWFQFSLMTAIVMMLVASGLLGLNMHEFENLSFIHDKDLGFIIEKQEHVQGWPFPVRQITNLKIIGVHSHEKVNELMVTTNWHLQSPQYQFHLIGIAIDVFCAIAVIIFLSTFTEYFVRRHERQKQEKAQVIVSRPWFRLSLMTTIGMMFTASAMLGLNMDEYEKTSSINDDYSGFILERHEYIQGWPFPARKKANFKIIGVHSHEKVQSLIAKDNWRLNDTGYTFQAGMIIDTLLAITVIILSAITIEYLVRRKERQKQEGGR